MYVTVNSDYWANIFFWQKELDESSIKKTNKQKTNKPATEMLRIFVLCFRYNISWS